MHSKETDLHLKTCKECIKNDVCFMPQDEVCPKYASKNITHYAYEQGAKDTAKEIEEMADKLYYNTPILEEETCNIVAEYLYNTGWVQLPCKVGDTLYVISQMKDKRILPFINKYEVTSICIKKKSIVIYHEMDGYIRIFKETDFGKTVFLFKEEAERVVTDIYDGSK